MKRREFIGLVGGAAAWPLAARAQPIKRIGVLLTYDESDTEGQARIAAFRDGLQKSGWIEGANIQIAFRWASTDRNQIERSAKELVNQRPDLIVAQNTPATSAVLQHSRSIPVVFFQASDPEGSGFVASLPRPDGNVTGFIDIEASLVGK